MTQKRMNVVMPLCYNEKSDMTIIKSGLRVTVPAEEINYYGNIKKKQVVELLKVVTKDKTDVQAQLAQYGITCVMD